MGQQLKLNHRLRIDILKRKAKFSKLDQYLEKISGKGFDVAAIPFRVLDDLLAQGTTMDFQAIEPLGRHTMGGQPRLLAAILDGLGQDMQDGLRDIVADGTAHPMTRFEAMGWATYLRHRATFPIDGRPAGEVFQFWDQPKPPSEILQGKALWQRCSENHVWYDDPSARQYITEGFGQDAARAYSDLWHPALKSDVFRLYRLARDGGIYCDADSMPEHRASEFLRRAGGRVWASSMTSVPNCVTINGFIAAPAGNPLIEALLEHVLRNIRDQRGRGIFWLSGPGAFTTFLFGTAGKFDIGLLSQGSLKSELFRQFDARYKHTEQNWRVYEHNLNLNNDAGLKHALDGL
jgi:glycosyl transferase-like sugar-binding protein